MLTKEEMDMTFVKWVIHRHNIKLKLNKYGNPIDQDQYDEICDKFHDTWESERREYWAYEKQESINSAINALQQKGYKPVLKCFNNAHIQVKSKKQGKLFNFYATTGTITGYGCTPVKGVDCLIDLLERY